MVTSHMDLLFILDVVFNIAFLLKNVSENGFSLLPGLFIFTRQVETEAVPSTDVIAVVAEKALPFTAFGPITDTRVIRPF